MGMQCNNKNLPIVMSFDCIPFYASVIDELSAQDPTPGKAVLTAVWKESMTVNPLVALSLGRANLPLSLPSDRTDSSQPCHGSAYKFANEWLSANG